MNERRKQGRWRGRKKNGKRDPKGPVDGVLPDVNVEGSSRDIMEYRGVGP